jgi:predicted permease
MWNDLRLGARLLVRDRWFTLAAVLTLALGIAATNTVFTVVNAVLLRPLPVDEPDRLVDLGEVSYPDLRDWREGLRTLADIAAFDERSVSVADESIAAERFRGAYVSANALSVVRQHPMLGRDFRTDDEGTGAPLVIILGHQLWRMRYGLDPAIIGRTIRVNGVPSTVIGVMPEGFGFPQIAELWLPLSFLRAEVLQDRDDAILAAFGRLRPDVTRAQARAELATMTAQLTRTYPKTQRRLDRPVTAFRSGVGLGTPVSVAFMFLMGAVTFVLLIACANVANLLLARSAARAREVSVRMSIGASRWQIVRQLLVETSILAAVAGGLALLLSIAGLDAIWRVVQQSGEAPPYWLTLAMDRRVFVFLASACLGACMLSGLAPAWVTSRTRLVDLLTDGGRGGVGSRPGRRWTSAFVVGQLALTLILLSGAGLMIRSLVAQVRTEAGVDLDGLVNARLDLVGARYASPEQRVSFYRQIEERLASLPGVRVSFASDVPLAGAPERRLLTELRPELSQTAPLVGQMTIGARYFEMLGTRPVRGRMFRHGDADGNRVAVINERLAAMYFPEADAIGRRIRLAAPGNSATVSEWLTIVGIAPNVRQESREGGDFDPLVYVPVDFNPVIGTNLIARSALAPGSAASLLRQQLADVDPDLPLFDIQTVDQRLVFERWAQRFTSSLFSIFAGVALVLAAVGLYAVTTYAASRRTKEIGVRMALGAQARDVWWTVTATAARQVSTGLALGIGGGVAISRVLPAQLTGASGSDPATFVAVAGLLVVVAFAAAALPARRAVRLDPMVALRTE